MIRGNKSAHAVKISVRYVYMYMYDMIYIARFIYMHVLHSYFIHVYDPLCPTNVAN